jgi:4-hydroxy-tetrahydrodipicolinate synthase
LASSAEAKEWSKDAVQGLWYVHWTPFDEDFNIDENGLRQHIRRTLELEPDGISAAGVLAEVWHLSIAERKFVGQVVHEELAGRVPAYFSATHHSTEDTLDLVRFAQEIGYESVMLWPPYEHAKSEREIYDFYEYIAGKTDIAIIAYSTPHSGRLISPELVDALANIDAVCAIKYVTWTFADYVRATELASDRIVVSMPFEDRWLASLLYFGNQALCTTTATSLFQTKEKMSIRDYTRLAKEGKALEATVGYYELQPLRELWERIYSIYPTENRHPLAETKYWAKKLGLLDDARVRPPQVQISDQTEALIDAVLEQEDLIASAFDASPIAAA